jgi:hypothetical protein
VPAHVHSLTAIGVPIPEWYSDPSGLLGSRPPEESLLLLADYWPWGKVWPGDIAAADEFEVKDKRLAKLGFRDMREYLDHHGSDASKRYDAFFAARSVRSCHICGIRPTLENPTVHIQIHHLSYRRFGHENPRDLLPLCEPHHKKVHETQHAYGGRNSLSWYVAYEALRQQHELPTRPVG